MAAAAARTARALSRDFGEIGHLQTARESTGGFVAAALARARQVLADELARARPSFAPPGGDAGNASDAGNANGGGARWIAEPLDGVANFVHALPQLAIAIAVERDGEAVAGIVFDPLRDELFWGEKGRGAYVNRQRLRVSGRSRLADALIADGNRGRMEAEDAAGAAQRAARMGARVLDVRRMGTPALELAYVAAGRFDGFWGEGLQPWQTAAGTVLVREAGGYATDIAGAPAAPASASLLAGNPHLHSQLHKVLAGR